MMTRQRLTTLRENAKNPDEATYFAYLQGIADRLAGHRDAARENLRTAIQADALSRWAPKIRFELAGIELAAGNWAAAEELARAEAIRLLSGDRKDSLAEVYHAFARGCSGAQRSRWIRPTPTRLTSCSPRPATWPRARLCVPSSCSPWAAPA